MPGKKAEAYTWLYTEGGGEVPATDSKAARLVRNEKDAALLLRALVKQIGLPAVLRLLSKVSADCVEDVATKQGGKK
jgi:hypothetical protein